MRDALHRIVLIIRHVHEEHAPGRMRAQRRGNNKGTLIFRLRHAKHPVDGFPVCTMIALYTRSINILLVKAHLPTSNIVHDASAIRKSYQNAIDLNIENRYYLRILPYIPSAFSVARSDWHRPEFV
jgi:hypothetical protein